jgi:hypothetical protein
MSNLVGGVGEIRLTVEIKRKDTGKVETYDLVGTITDEQIKELQHGGNSQHSSEERGD